MRLKKSIAVVVLALAVPVVYLVASVHAADESARRSSMNFAQDQTPPPQRRAEGPSVQPARWRQAAATDCRNRISPTRAGSSRHMPAAAVVIRRGSVPNPPVGPVAPTNAHRVQRTCRSDRTDTPWRLRPRWRWPVDPLRDRPLATGIPIAYGYDDEQRFVIVTGKSDSLTMSGSTEDAHHVEKLRKTIPGDFIWFQRDEKSYIIRDQATIDRAQKFWAPQEELGKKQEELGKQQEALGKQQEELGAKMEQVQINVPDMTAELDKLKAELKKLSSGATVEQVGEMQSEIGELQSKIGEIQSQAGDQQSKIGEQMGALGEKQGKLGEQQGELGRQQGELAHEATKKMKALLDEAIAKGIAQLEL